MDIPHDMVPDSVPEMSRQTDPNFLMTGETYESVRQGGNRVFDAGGGPRTRVYRKTPGFTNPEAVLQAVLELREARKRAGITFDSPASTD